MPIKINLLAEAQAHEEMRRKDPVKRAIWVSAFLVFLMLLWASVLYFETMTARSAQQNLAGAWKDMEKQYLTLSNSLKTTTAIAAKLNGLNRYSTNRFLWGSTLNALQQSIPPGLNDRIQIIHLGSSQQFTQTESVAPKKSGTRTIPGKPATSTEKITITIDGKDYGGTTEQNYNKFKTDLASQPYIKSRVPMDAIILKNISPPSTDSGDQRQYIIFTLEMQFPPVTRDE